ncbi:2,3,4,5-tetrahydropyridine-2,6-carboxylate N-succinyltransferase [Candidatus Marinamargulisbacteria bacterium SCGC AG-414-C22]|nr:2,3,4,5-tetrahydropyridine-2,6-carboxylate N-succinyltransferase [Candidatus Marinamargulisbacteria bacterium SCGC AG-414-C22]
MKQLSVIGLGIKRSKDQQVLDVLIPYISETEALNVTKNKFTTLTTEDVSKLPEKLQNNAKKMIENSQPTNGYANVTIGYIYMDNLNEDIHSAEESYFKLQLISQRFAKPHDLNLTNLFGSLTNVAWSNKGPLLPEDVPTMQIKYQASDAPLTITHIDKFPYLVNYHIPSNVRIAAGSQVRLGAYLGEGTTVMPAGYVNFNGGTLGQAMVEGRVSAGVVVGDKSDVGGGASIMGTLSGGNKEVISIGEQCLLGANSGTGISLGNGCTIAAGLYVTAGSPVFLYDQNNNPVDHDGNPVSEPENCVKAHTLTGKPYLLFLQDSKTGRLICKPNQKVIELNDALHKN